MGWGRINNIVEFPKLGERDGLLRKEVAGEDPMISKIEKEISYSAGDTTSTNAELLRLRLLMYFGVAVLTSFTLFVVDRWFFPRLGDVSFSRFFSYYNELYLLHPISFFAAFLMILLFRFNVRKLQIIDYLTVTANLLLVAFAFAVFSPGLAPTYPMALIILFHAALVPTRVWVQIVIGITATLSIPLSEGLAYYFLPEIQPYWSAKGGWNQFLAADISHTIDVAVLSALAVLITYSLYSYRRNLSRAQRLGNYIIKGELGRGGMGAVFEASHAFLRRPTAIKVMMPKEGDRKNAALRFEKEVKLASSLNHPNTITIFDYGHCCNYSIYYAMELLEGLDLERYVKKFGPLSANRAIYILTQVCGSLAEAHSKGIIHRDIKPSNIFLTQRGGLYDFVKVLDFGLAKQIRGDKSLEDTGITQAGALVGTPRYISPESVQSRGKVDGRTDIYMLGSVAYWILTGQPPFAGSSSVDLIVDHIKTIPRRPSEVSELPIPKALDDIVMKCLEKEQDDRFQSPNELAEALSQVPLELPWSQRHAREWWTLHMTQEEMIPALKPTVEIPGGQYQPEKVMAV